MDFVKDSEKETKKLKVFPKQIKINQNLQNSKCFIMKTNQYKNKNQKDKMDHSKPNLNILENSIDKISKKSDDSDKNMPQNSESNEILLQKEKIQNLNNFTISKDSIKSMQSLQKSNISTKNDDPTKIPQNSSTTSPPNLNNIENPINISSESFIIDDDYEQSVQGIAKMRQKYINYPQISYLNVNSLRNKIHDIRNLVSQISPTILLIRLSKSKRIQKRSNKRGRGADNLHKKWHLL